MWPEEEKIWIIGTTGKPEGKRKERLNSMCRWIQFPQVGIQAMRRMNQEKETFRAHTFLGNQLTSICHWVEGYPHPHPQHSWKIRTSVPLPPLLDRSVEGGGESWNGKTFFWAEHKQNVAHEEKRACEREETEWWLKKRKTMGKRTRGRKRTSLPLGGRKLFDSRRKKGKKR